VQWDYEFFDINGTFNFFGTNYKTFAPNSLLSSWTNILKCPKDEDE
jgi:hypothetical protein